MRLLLGTTLALLSFTQPAAQTVTKPAAGFDVTVKVTLDEALAIYTALSGRPTPFPIPDSQVTVQQAVQQILINQIAALVDQGQAAEANDIKTDLKGMSKADRDAIRAEIAKRRKKP